MIHESSLTEIVGAEGEAVVFHREPAQHPRCGKIGSPLGEKMSIMIEFNIGRKIIFMCLSRNLEKSNEIRCISEISTFFINYSG